MQFIVGLELKILMSYVDSVDGGNDSVDSLARARASKVKPSPPCGGGF